jgi:hypothetical protein
MDDIRKGVCPLCRHNEIHERRYPPEGFHERFITQPPTPIPSGKIVSPYGISIRYVCRRCGFAQMFVHAPELLPITNDDRLIKGPEPEGPYR